MNTPLKVEFKIGEIEFKAEGDPIDVEKQRESFVNILLPLAVDVVARTRDTIIENHQYTIPSTAIISEAEDASSTISIPNVNTLDFSRESLSSYINKFGAITDQDFVMLAIYFEECKNGKEAQITSEDVSQYYAETRRKKYSNISQLFSELVKKGFVQEVTSADDKKHKHYTLTNDGIKFAEAFVPKEKNTSKTKTSKTKKLKQIHKSTYSNLNADNLNLNKYPKLGSPMSFKEQMLLLMYIVSCENYGDEFSVADIQYLMTYVVGIHATLKQISGVFDRNKTWFANVVDPTNKKALKHKLLNGAKEYAQSVINKYTVIG